MSKCPTCGSKLEWKANQSSMKPLIVKITGYQGDVSSLEVDPDPQYIIVDAVTGDFLDSGYGSYEEAREAYALIGVVNTRKPQ